MFLRFAFALSASVLSPATVHAALYTVGADGACTHPTIVAATAAADAHPGPDTIHIAYNLDYTAQQIAFSASEEVDLVGGFADCSQATSDGIHTTIDGVGGDTEPVFRITVATGGLVKLSYLTIQHGDEDGNGKGGGIYFKGNGVLEINHATVTQNTAGYGGGIYAEGTGGETELVIGEDVAIVGNTARFDGGGIVNDGTEMTMTQPDSYISFNHAPNGYGGGLYVRGDDRKAYTYLGSTGFGNLGPIYLNDAARGGGVALHGTDHEAALHVFTTDPARPMRIKGNTASVEGGGIWLGPDHGWVTLWGWDVRIEDNIAPRGAAFVDRNGAVLFNNAANRPLGSIDCPVGVPCGSIVGNEAEDGAGQPSGGVIDTAGLATVYLNRMTMEGNSGRFVFHSDDSMTFHVRQATITGNTVSGSLIATDADNDRVYLENVTIAGNSIGDDTVLRLSNRDIGGPGKLHRTIIWQPGKTTLQLMGDPLDLLDVMVSERFSVDGGNSPNVVERDPRFVDPEHGDYALRAGSPAVDRTTSVAADSKDLFSNARDVDLPITANLGLRDLGAIERQTLQPLVLNSDFDGDLRLWSIASADVTTWDASRNVSGAAGSGSAHITLPNAVTGTQVGGLVQCVHLPGPGTYALNGWGHGTGTAVAAGDIAELYWEYRRSGGEGCTDGTPDAFGVKSLSNSNSWSRPATPAFIVVTEQDWTYTSSIAVTLVAVENSTNGAPTNAWFDGITLGIEGDDTIFANSFEGP